MIQAAAFKRFFLTELDSVVFDAYHKAIPSGRDFSHENLDKVYQDALKLVPTGEAPAWLKGLHEDLKIYYIAVGAQCESPDVISGYMGKIVRAYLGFSFSMGQVAGLNGMRLKFHPVDEFHYAWLRGFDALAKDVMVKHPDANGRNAFLYAITASDLVSYVQYVDLIKDMRAHDYDDIMTRREYVQCVLNGEIEIPCQHA